jgi:hypothetical protein
MLKVDKVASPAHPIRPVAIGIGALTLAGMFASSSPLVVLASGSVAVLTLVLLWRPGELPILLLPAFYQFVQIALKPIMTAFTGTSLQDLSDFDANLEPAALFGLAALTALAVGLRWGTGRARTPSTNLTIESLPFSRILAVALAAIAFGHALDIVSAMVAGARQIALALSGVKWAGLFILAYSTLRLRRGVPLLAGVVVFEIVLGVSGFFADFRLVLFVLLGAMLATYGTLRARGIVTLAAGAALTLFLGVFWSSVKKDYRSFLNQGTGEQVVLQPLDERLSYLASEAAEFDSEQFAEGFDNLLARLSYIDFLAVTMKRVPEAIPHEDGARLAEAVLHVLTPRVLFPDKSELRRDTEVTAYYTDVADAVRADERTSISIGYLGELYIDFGIGGALLAVFLMGIASGRCYRAIRDHPGAPAFFNQGLCMMVALALATFDTSLTKLVGGFVMVVAAALLLQRWIWPALISGHVGASHRRNFVRQPKA